MPRPGFSYDPYKGIVATACTVSSTILPVIVTKKEFWGFALTNFFLFLLYTSGYYQPEKYSLHLPWKLTSTTGGLMTFFVVFYNSHCFSRYCQLYDVTKRMQGMILEITSHLRGRIPNMCHQRRALRYIVASCFVFFFERSAGEISHNEWQQMLELQLLKAVEVSALKKLEAGGYNLHLLHWALEVIMDGIPDVHSRDDLMNCVFDKIYYIRVCQAKIKDTLDLPMPFQYFHIMSFMLMINLSLWSYALAMQDSYFAPVIYTFIQMVFQSIRELSAALSDPFGDDDVDFPVSEWLEDMIHVSTRLLEDTYDATKRLDNEEAYPVDDFFEPHISSGSLRTKGQYIELPQR
mmetsp:Transcript_46978/g.124356  ORF Transcript_46978/g.124356 Transcript_46978/m.124356 type:complete len:349 (+) Transcript_46978:135-1181(+)